jgi:DNA-binding NarL/FixJ family response regulator
LVKKSRQNHVLWGLLALQTGCAGFFLFDAATDALGLEAQLALPIMDQIEGAAAIALCAGIAATVLHLRHLAHRQTVLLRQVEIASGAFADLLEVQFDDWALSVSERDVALLVIKGLSNAEIAAMRQTREGTIKAQTAAVYRKAHVSGRTQLISLFIEELLAAPLVAEGM